MKQRVVRIKRPVSFLLLCIALTGCNWLEESDYSHCVIADNANSFNGEKLKNDGTAKSYVMLTTDCIEKDKNLDGGDGKSKGKVRWVVCLKGPDCDEAGMF